MKWYNLKPERVIPVLLGVLLTAAVFSRCGGGGNPPHPPTPPPTPGPTPVPTAMVLSIRGNQFFDGNSPLDMKMMPFCCAPYVGTFGWPTASEHGVREAKRMGANFLHIRLGPHTPRNEGNINSSFLPAADGRADLSKHNPAFEANVLKVVALTQELHMGIEVDGEDTWGLRTGNIAWCKANNVNGYDVCGCDAVRHPIDARRAAFLTHWADILKDYKHITYQTGNESFLCRPTRDWEESVIKAIRKGDPDAIIGSNSRQPWSETIANYTTYHSTVHATPRAKPVEVNEVKDEIVSAEAFCTEYQAAKAEHTYFPLWIGNRTLAQLEAAAKCWTTPPSPPPTGDIKIDPGTGLPYRACTVQPMPVVECHCNKISGPCPGDMVPDAIGGQMTGMLKAAPKAGVSGTSVVNRQAYYVSILNAAKAAGYCAKIQSLDEAWLRGPNGRSYGFDIVTQPATGGMFIGSMKNVVQCFPSGV